MHDRNSTHKSNESRSILDYINTSLLPPLSCQLSIIEEVFNFFKFKIKLRIFIKKFNLINYLIRKTKFWEEPKLMHFFINALKNLSMHCSEMILYEEICQFKTDRNYLYKIIFHHITLKINFYNLL